MASLITTGLVRDRVTWVWAVLVVVTLLSFWLGTDHGLSSTTARSLLIIVLALVKVRFVGLYFMELRTAPVWLRAAFEGWCLVVGLALMGFYVVLLTL